MKTDSKKALQQFRQQIDQMDGNILELLAKRGRLAQAIGKVKEAHGLEVYVPSREKEVFAHIRALNGGPYSDASLFAIYREIISATRALEQPTRVSFLGPKATFTHLAAVHHFGSTTHYVPQQSIADVFAAVEKNHVDYGVVPVENSTEGVVNYTLDKFVESDLKICSEVIVKISQNLLSKDVDLKKVHTIYSHPQAFAQCRKWLATHLPKARLIETESTALAAEIAAKKNGAAAIASAIAGDLFGLNRLQTAIQDEANNMTRFLVIGHTAAQKTGRDKTSIAFVGKHKAGVLFSLIKPFAQHKVNLTKIESRPLKTKAWNYMFFVDMEGHTTDRNVAKALNALAVHCESIKVLGSYPKA